MINFQTLQCISYPQKTQPHFNGHTWPVAPCWRAQLWEIFLTLKREGALPFHIALRSPSCCPLPSPDQQSPCLLLQQYTQDELQKLPAPLGLPGLQSDPWVTKPQAAAILKGRS